MTIPSGELGEHGPLVLIVDDNERNLKLARDVLRAAGFRTVEAASGEDGLARAAERMPDVVLLDLRLPDLDGVEVLRRLRDDERTTQLPVVALTALRVEGIADSLLATGFAGVLEKPISVADFPLQVRAYCEPKPT